MPVATLATILGHGASGVSRSMFMFARRLRTGRWERSIRPETFLKINVRPVDSAESGIARDHAGCPGKT